MADIRSVDDPYPTVGATYCLKSLTVAEHKARLCCLPKGHRGTCLPWDRVPRTDVSDENPKYDPSPRSVA